MSVVRVHKYVLGYSRPFERWLVPVTTSHPHSYVSRLWHEGTYIQWGTGSIRKFHRLAKIWWLKCDAMQRYADAATAHKSPDSWVADYRNKWSWDPNCHRPQTLDIFSGLALPSPKNYLSISSKGKRKYLFHKRSNTENQNFLMSQIHNNFVCTGKTLPFFNQLIFKPPETVSTLTW